MAAVRGFGPLSLASLGLQTHVAHELLNPPARVPVPLPAQFGVDAGRAIDPALGRKDAADVPAQLGLRLNAALSRGDRAQPSVEAADTHANHPAQRGDGMVGALGCTKVNVLTRSPGRKKLQLS